MKVVKPDNLSLRYSVFPDLPGVADKPGDHCLVVAVMAGFPLATGQPELLPENILWQRIQEALPEGEILDQGLPKPRAEYLVYGACCSRHPVTGKEIRVRVGNLGKRLHVTGPRFRRMRGPGRPREFTRIPVVWQHAYGGQGYPDNPLGLGHARLPGGLQPLPLVTAPGHSADVASWKDNPVGLTAIPSHWPQRRQYLGTVDARWLERSWPGLPRDYQAEHACTAPPDQRFSGFLLGGEPVAVSGMHPDKEHVRGALPRLRARLFVQRKGDAAGGPGAAFEEVACRLETFWLFPESETGVLLFRGVTRARDEECADVGALLCDLESLDHPPLPAACYQERCVAALGRGRTQRVDLDGKAGPSEASGSGMPETAAGPTKASWPGANLAGATLAGATLAGATLGMAASSTVRADQVSGPDIPEVQSLAARLETEIRQHLEAIGVSEEQAATFLTRSAAEEPPLPEPVESPREMLDQLQLTARNLESETEALFRRHGLNPEMVQEVLRTNGESGQVAEEEVLQGLNDLLEREDLPEDVRGAIRSTLAGFQEVQAALALLAARILPAPLRANPSSREESSRPATELSGPLTTEQALERHSQGMGLAGCDLSQCDFAGLDLSGADMRRAILDGVAWPNVLLAGADLRGAMAQRADLRGAILTGADLSGAVLEQACLRGIAAQGCTARRTRFMGADLRRADLDQADLQSADCTRADLGKARLTGIRGRDLRLNSAMLHFADCSGADLQGIRADTGTNAAEARFQGANLQGARLAGATFSRADFSHAVLDGADLCKADLDWASLFHATAREARFIKARLRHAGLVGLNLFQGSLRHADCTAARIENANLFGVDLYRCILDPAQLKDVELGRTLLQPGLLEQRG
ncbi:DUF2169 family type VI secretion system accessory protein [Desulfonatronum parangueonense]